MENPFELFAIDALLSEEGARDPRRGAFCSSTPGSGLRSQTGSTEALCRRELCPRTRELGAGDAPEGYQAAQVHRRSPTAWPVWNWRPGTQGSVHWSASRGSLAMFAIHAFGSEEHKQQWLPGTAAGEKIGCFWAHGGGPPNPSGMRTNAKRDGDDWVLNGSKMDHQRQHRRRGRGLARTDDGIRGFVVPPTPPGLCQRDPPEDVPAPGHQRELVLEDVTARGRGVPGVVSYAARRHA